MPNRMSRCGALLLASSVVACGDDGEPIQTRDASARERDGGGEDELDAGREDDGDDCQTFVSDSLIQHACFHERMGPHAERIATPTPSGVEVDRPHTSFRVTLPAAPGGGYLGVVSYQARFAGTYAIFARDAELRVRAEDSSISASFAHDTELCPELPRVAAFALQAQRYTFEIRSAVAEVVLVVESMDEGAVDDAYRHNCAGKPTTPRDAAVFVLDGGPLDAAVAQDGDTKLPDAADDDSGDAGSEGGVTRDAEVCRVDPVLEHSCLHALHGPFAPLNTTVGTPDISRAHTAFQLTLPMDASGRATYRPNADGEYVFFLDRAAPLTLLSQGIAQTPTYVEPVAVDDCAKITEARVFSLVGKTRYDVDLGPVAGDSLTVIVESVNSLTSNGWAGRLQACH